MTEREHSDNISLAPNRNLDGVQMRKQQKVLEQLKSGKETKEHRFNLSSE
ncbi:MAG: hypothetical protein NVS4B11_35140 [Ktedonobacteraceae bacterium]